MPSVIQLIDFAGFFLLRPLCLFLILLPQHLSIRQSSAYPEIGGQGPFKECKWEEMQTSC